MQIYTELYTRTFNTPSEPDAFTHLSGLKLWVTARTVLVQHLGSVGHLCVSALSCHASHAFAQLCPQS
jgi:hypothetical protein